MKLCRICIQEIVGDSFNLFISNEESEKYCQKIFLCSQVLFREDDFFKSVNEICSGCFGELHIAYNFRLKCLKSDQELKLYFLRQSQQNVENDSKTTEVLKETSTICKETKGTELEAFEQFNKKENTEKSIICELCGKSLKTASSLLSHNLKMHENRKHLGKVTGFGAARRYHCTECVYSTPHSQTLVNHLRKHSGERPFHCHCGKSFTQSSALSAHSKTHSSATYYTCSVCGKQFKHAFSLKKHLKVHEESSYKCTICKKLLKSKDTLQHHMHRHNNVRNYNCEECGETFVTASELINHKKRHKLVKTFECHLCGYKTHTKKLLILHIKRHTGDKSHKCEQCAVSFITLGELNIHKRMHTREKPYACPTCSQRFMHSPSVNKHMRNVHGIDYKWGEFKHNFMNQIKQLF